MMKVEKSNKNVSVEKRINSELHDEFLKQVQLLPEAKHKSDYYKEVLLANTKLAECIEHELKKENVSELKKARLRVEQIDVLNSIYYQKQAFEVYMQRKSKYEATMESVLAESEALFDEVFEKCQKELKHNIRLMSALADFKKKEQEGFELSRIERASFYSMLKTEIDNFNRYKKK